MDTKNSSRRSFLISSSGLLGAAALAGVSWSEASWADVSAAAHHAASSGTASPPAKLNVLTDAEAIELDAIQSMIIPSGKTPGAHEARTVYFSDFVLGGLMAAGAASYRASLATFGKEFSASHGGKSFSAARVPERVAYLKTIERTPFFTITRMLTVLGFLTSPKYGGNAEGLGWKAIGFQDQHVFSPPFGYYDKDYPGFVPYGTEKHS